MGEESNSADIRYTVKEVLSRIEGKLDLLSMQLQQKADISHVAALDNDVQSLKRDMQEGKETVKSMLIPQFNDVVNRLAIVERDAVSQSAVTRYKTWLLVTAAPALLGAGYAILRILDLVKGR